MRAGTTAHIPKSRRPDYPVAPFGSGLKRISRTSPATNADPAQPFLVHDPPFERWRRPLRRVELFHVVHKIDADDAVAVADARCDRCGARASLPRNYRCHVQSGGCGVRIVAERFPLPLAVALGAAVVGAILVLFFDTLYKTPERADADFLS